jgi:hypothetical protein
MGQHRYLPRVDQRGHGEHVVEVGVCEQDGRHVQACGRGEDTLGLVAGVDDQCRAAGGHDPAVGLQHADDHLAQLHAARRSSSS